MRPIRARVVGATLLAVLAIGCGGGQGAPKSQDPQVRAQELIESGNSAYRAGQYAVAAKRYAAAAVEKKDDPAAYYGMGMALTKLGRDEEARRAYAKARELAQTRAAEGR